MFLKKICYIICAIFLIENLYDIYDDSNSVQYIIKNDNTDEDIVFSFCIELNQTLLENFHNLNNEYQFTVKDLVEHTCYKFFSETTCTNLIDLKRSYLFNYHSCLIFNNTDFDILIRNLSSIDFHIFSISGYRSELYFYENVFSNKNAAFKLNHNLRPFTLNIEYSKVYRLEYPYHSDCVIYSNYKIDLKTKELINSRSSCLFECFKIESKSRSLNYYYSRRDDELLIVNQDDLNQLKIKQKIISDQNLTIDLKEKCMNKCNYKACTFQYYSTDIEFYKHDKFNLKYDLKIFQAIPSTSRYQFIINFISLIVLFLNISIFDTLPYLIKKILSNYYRQYLTRFNKYYWLVKLFIFILCLIIVISLSIFRIIDYNNMNYNRLEAYNFPTEIIPFYLLICLPVQILIYNKNELDENIELNLFNTKSFTEIENLTNFTQFEKNLDMIYIEYASVKRLVDSKIDKTKTVFRYFDYKFENHKISNFLLRCFRLDFNFKEPRYDMLYSLSKLVIKLKTNWSIVYPLAKNQNLSTREHCINLVTKFHLKKYKKKVDCLDYSKYRSFQNYRTRINRIDNCVNNMHLKKYSNLTIQSVIFKEMIPLKYKLDNIYFNYNLDKNISDDCFRKFERNFSCFRQVFKTKRTEFINQTTNRFSMYLYFPEYLISDNQVLTLSDLLLNNLFSFECIFIGLNVGKILFILFLLLKKYKFNRIFNYYKYLKIFILLIGLSIHFYLIIDDILNGEYIFQQEFSHLADIFQPPNFFFCLEFNTDNIDYNYRQTTNYLDDLTKNLNLNIFQNISLVNEKYDEFFFVPNKLETFKYIKKIYTLYYLNLKCFEFVFRPIKDIRQLYLLNELNFINIKFNETKIREYFNSSNFEFYFISKQEITHEINGIYKIKIDYNENPLIVINQELTILHYEEKFPFIKNPLYILYDKVNLNDTTDYINQLINGFQVFNLKTKRIPAISKDFRYLADKDGNLEIDDELFDQFYDQIKNLTDYNSFKALDFTRKIYFTHLIQSKTQHNNDYDLKFFFDLHFKTYSYTNRDNHSKFIISILNCLNTWLNFCCFDTYIYLLKFCNLIYKFYQLILNFKFYLDQKRSFLFAQTL